jgi:hypothetical protein
MRYHPRIAKRRLATLLLVGSMLTGVTVTRASASVATPPPPIISLTTGPTPPGFCNVSFCFVFHAGGFSLSGALQPPPFSAPPPPF